MATPRELLAEDKPVKRSVTHTNAPESTQAQPKGKQSKKGRKYVRTPPLDLQQKAKRNGPGGGYRTRLDELHDHIPYPRKARDELVRHLQPLSLQQRKFVLSYMEHGNSKKAAIEAGYSPKSAAQAGSYLLSCPNIIIAISYEQQRLLERHDLTAGWVIARLRMESLYTGPGSTQAARVRALELLAKHLGIITDKREVTANITSTHLQGVITLDCSKLSPEECDRLLQQQQPALDPNTLLALPQSQVVTSAITEAIVGDETDQDDIEVDQEQE